jgi:Domain of unknown function (DUF222)/HNH endonuclease
VMTALDALMTPPGPDDERTAAQRRADALVDLCRLGLSRDWLPTVAGQRPQVGVLVTPATLRSQRPDPRTRLQRRLSEGRPAGASVAATEPAHMEWVGEVPASLAQRLACDSQVWRVSLDPATGLPLELGRSQRLVPGWLRRALHARDRSCRWPGCVAPNSWTDAHHITPWYDGGATDIDNMLCLCRYHHAKVHEGQWRLEFDHGTGEVRVFRPDGRPYEVSPSRPWTGPATQRGDPLCDAA